MIINNIHDAFDANHFTQINIISAIYNMKNKIL